MPDKNLGTHAFAASCSNASGSAKLDPNLVALYRETRLWPVNSHEQRMFSPPSNASSWCRVEGYMKSSTTTNYTSILSIGHRSCKNVVICPCETFCFPYCFSLGSLVSAQWFPILPRELAWNPTCSFEVAHSCTALNEFSKFHPQFSGIFQFHIVPHNFPGRQPSF